MKPVYVVFPVLRGKRRFLVERGRRWSVVEHIVLDAVCRGSASAAQLSAKTGLPRRVIVEALIRLMRAGWVEIAMSSAGPVFRGTAAGVREVPAEQLRAATTTEPRWRSFAIEQVTGSVFRARELDIRPQSRVPVGNNEQIVFHLPASEFQGSGDLGEIFSAIEDEDEMIVGVERSAEKLLERYAVVAVRDNVIEGLPARATPLLRALIAKHAGAAVAADAAKNGTSSTTDLVEVSETPDANFDADWEVHHALYDPSDLIIDGPAHRGVLDRVIRNAKERILIHSTFVSEASALALLPTLLQAANRGVSIRLLWGQDDTGGTTSDSRAAAAKLQAAVAEAGRSDLITVHPFSTNSHAKIVVADNGRGTWIALVGSCNWLLTDFRSFEATIRLRDPFLVGAIVRRLANLSRGRPGLWDERSVEMTILGRRIEAIPRGNGRTVPMRLLLAPDHARLVLEARDRARRRIFVLSHRIGVAARSVALLPALAAIRANNVEAQAFYGRTTGPLSGLDSAELTRSFAKEGLSIRPVHRPRLHAKVLGWDDDALAISSLNWLSADPAHGAENREIGVFVEAPRLADNFLRVFENARYD